MLSVPLRLACASPLQIWPPTMGCMTDGGKRATTTSSGVSSPPYTYIIVFIRLWLLREMVAQNPYASGYRQWRFCLCRMLKLARWPTSEGPARRSHMFDTQRGSIPIGSLCGFGIVVKPTSVLFLAHVHNEQVDDIDKCCLIW